jgi:hypothetical protein
MGELSLPDSYVFSLYLVQRSAVGFVPDKNNNKAGNGSPKVSEVGNIIADFWIYTSKKIDCKIT